MSIVDEYEELVEAQQKRLFDLEELVETQRGIILGYQANADNLEKNFCGMMKIINQQTDTIQQYNSQVVRLLALVDSLSWWLMFKKRVRGLFKKKD